MCQRISLSSSYRKGDFQLRLLITFTLASGIDKNKRRKNSFDANTSLVSVFQMDEVLSTKICFE